MSVTEAIEGRIGAAVHQNPLFSRKGLLERGFSRLFRGLVYAQIWEDPVADMAALDLGPGDRLICIASGGCNVMSYLTAAPDAITAVDLSPAHIALLKLKLVAARHLDQAQFFAFFGRADRRENPAVYERFLAPHLDVETRTYWESRVIGRRRIGWFARGFYRFGVLGRFLGTVGVLARLTGVDLKAFLSSPDLEAQRQFYRDEVAPLFDRPLIRRLARSRAALFGLGIPPAQHEKLARDGGGDVLGVLRERTRKLMCDFPLADNYFAWQACSRAYAPGDGCLPPYLQAQAFAAVREGAVRVTALNRSFTEYLAGEPAASQTAYVLLDAQDWMTDAQLNDLWREITRTAAPGARVLFRTGGTDDILPGRVTTEILGQWRYDETASAAAFAADRSAIYGGVHLYRLLK